MTWTTTDRPDAFTAAAGGFLRSRPDRYSAALSALASLDPAAGANGARFGWWGRDRIEGAFVWTPPRPLIVCSLPEGAADSLAAELPPGVAEVHGYEPTARAVADAWARRNGRPVSVRVRQRLYRLDELREPDPAPPGRARRAGAADEGLLREWAAAFLRDVGDDPAAARHVLPERAWTFWEDGGRPVSMAGVTADVAGAVRIGGVYTPGGARGKGYAGAVTAAVSRAALDAGVRDVLLFTDLANPTSNALYQRLGFRALEDHAVIALGAPEEDGASQDGG